MQENLAEKIKQRIDLVEFVRQYVPHLKKAGKTWKACCPFHKEKTPSFSVNPKLGIYKCFSCGAGGDALSFINEHFVSKYRYSFYLFPFLNEKNKKKRHKRLNF